MLARHWPLAAFVYVLLLAATVIHGASIGMLLAQQVWEVDRERHRALVALDPASSGVAVEEVRWVASHPRPYQSYDAWLDLLRTHGAWWLAGITFALYALWMTGALAELEERRSFTRSRRAAELPPLRRAAERSEGSIW